MPAQKQQGFAPTELLVAVVITITIIVIAVVAFTGIQKNIRDSKRKADIETVSKAMEAHYDSVNGAYTKLTASWFSTSSFPLDPINRNYGCGKSNSTDVWEGSCWYCFKTGAGYCNLNDYNGSRGATGPVEDRPPAIAAGWYVCANLESPPGYYCIKNQQ